MKVASTVVAMVLGILLPLLVQRWDKKRLDDEARARSWTFATWGSALYAFGPLSMLGWSWVTRRGWTRIVFGPLWMGAQLALMLLVDMALHEAYDVMPETTLLEVVQVAAGGAAAGIALLALLQLRANFWAAFLRAWQRRQRAGKPAR